MNPIHKFKKALKMGALVIPLLALLGCPAKIENVSGTPEFVAVNYYDDAGAMVDINAGGSRIIESGLDFGASGDQHSVDAGTSVMFTFQQSSTTTILASETCPASLFNVVFSYGYPLLPKLANHMVTQQEAPLVTVINANHLATSGYDVYVTAPGADITAMTPDTPSIVPGEGRNLSTAAHAGATFQVRLCPTGTKTVAATFNNVVGASAETAYVFVAGVEGITVRTTQFTMITSP